MAETVEVIFQQLQGDLLGTLGIFRRPVNQLRALSIQHRWEVTRRHPYYLQYWQLARQFHDAETATNQDAEMMRILAVHILGAIGVSLATVNPQLEFKDFAAEDNDPRATAWLYGTVHPISFRGQLSLLMAALPPATLARIGQLLVACFSDGSEQGRVTAALQLLQLQDPALDRYADEPFLSVAPTASVREVQRDLPVALKPWRDRPGQVMHRDRSAHVNKYLQVWDLREGWTAGGYDNAAERSLREIAEQLKLSISTVSNHYRSAFELVTGHPYSPDTWLKVFGPLKLSSLFHDEAGPIALRRPLISPVPRPIPDQVISPASSQSSFVESNAIIDEGRKMTDSNMEDVRMDIKAMLEEGLTFEEMCLRLGVERDKAGDLESLWKHLDQPSLAPAKKRKH